MNQAEQAARTETERIYVATGKRTKRIMPGTRHVLLPDDLNSTEDRSSSLWSANSLWPIVCIVLIVACAASIIGLWDLTKTRPVLFAVTLIVDGLLVAGCLWFLRGMLGRKS